MIRPTELSGHGSKVLEVDLPQGRYRLSWTARPDDDYGDLTIILEEDGPSDPLRDFRNRLVDEVLERAVSGEVLARLLGGMHVFSIKASHLNWTIDFTPL